jgi:hypothetical protein
MQASIDKLTKALAAKLTAEEGPPHTHPAAILTPEPSGISDPIQTSKAPENIPERVQTSRETTEILPNTDNEISKDSIPTPMTSELIAESSDAAKKDDNGPTVEPEVPKSPSTKKHAKRSSFFGGFFG